MLRFVAEHPGAYPKDVARELDVAYSHVKRRMKAFETEGHMTSEAHAKQRHYYVAFTAWEKRFLPALMKEAPWTVLLHVAGRPGLDNREEIVAKTGLSLNAVRDNAEAFVDLGVLVRVPRPSEGRPGIGYTPDWHTLTPTIRFLLMKLKEDDPHAVRLRELLLYDTRKA